MNSARLKLPFLVPGQTQKELFHNEALQVLDMLTQPVITDIGALRPPSNSAVGDMYILGSNPEGPWTGHANELACYTEGGWRFVVPFDRMSVSLGSTGMVIRYEGGKWSEGRVDARTVHVDGKQVLGSRRAAIPSPVGGSVRDVELRQAVDQILSALRQHGLIDT